MCLNPLHINKHLSNGRIREMIVPCGVCPECLKKRQSAIVVRSYIEACKHPKLCMFTLTYNESKLPHNEFGEATLRREDIKNWKKEFRKLIGNKDFSWICCGEYSPRGWHRPHYHGLIFGLDKYDLSIISDCWEKRYGFTVFKPVAVSSQKDLMNVSRYISKYVVKDDEFKTPSSTVERPRLMSSVGFGFPEERFWNYVLCFDKFKYDPFDSSTITMDIVESVVDRLFFTIDGFKYSIPNYAIRKRLYYQDFTKKIQVSPLLKMVNFVKRFRNNALRYSEFKRFLSSNNERTFFENAVAFDYLSEVSNSKKLLIERENIISIYKKSVI